MIIKPQRADTDIMAKRVAKKVAKRVAKRVARTKNQKTQFQKIHAFLCKEEKKRKSVSKNIYREGV